MNIVSLTWLGTKYLVKVEATTEREAYEEARKKLNIPETDPTIWRIIRFNGDVARL
jgi:hypothetical protein